jgi:hypothetical protein
MDGLALRVRWSCERGGSGQCYFATESSPQMGEDKMLSQSLPGGRVVDIELALDRGGREPQVLTRFRLDPFNGAVGASFQIDEVVLVRLPASFEVHFGPARSSAAAGEKVELGLRLRRTGGRRLSGPALVEIAVHGEADRRLELDASAEDPRAECEVAFATPGVHALRARLHLGGRLTHDLESTIVIGAGSSPAGALLEKGNVAVELLSAAPPDGPGARAARLWARDGERWRDAGLLLPLVEVAIDDEGVVRRSHPALAVLEKAGGRLRLGRRDGDGAAPLPGVVLGFERGRGGGELLAVRASLRATGARLLKLACPTLRRVPAGTDPLERHALFGGIELLEPGWSSSSERAVGPKHAARWTPHPLKVCLPVMAIEQDGVTTALLWQPLDEWAPGRSLPAATFASPDFLEGRPEHLLQLFAPSVPDLVEENGTIGRRPVVLGDETVQIAAAVRVACGEPVAETARRWYEHFGIPEAPPAPHDERSTHDLVARCFGETVWWPEEKGWRHHWFLGHSSSHRPDMAAELVLHARRTGERRWVDRTGLNPARSVIEILGTLWDRAAGAAEAARRAANTMRDDGTYAYHDTAQVKEQVRRHSGGRFDSLGEEGSTSLGTCVQGALPLLRHALFTSDPAVTAAAEKALGAMRRFRVPRGAQVWEVHQQIPDIRAAALAVEAFHLGYLLTGDEGHLEEARRWATTGLAFLYSWRIPEGPAPVVVRTSRDREDASKTESLPLSELFRDPQRQVTPFGTIPVLGTTFHVMSWFGVIVQWCGLEWAAKVLALCEERDDPLLRAAALGVLRSGLQQTFDREPWTGLYPDVWNPIESWAGGALICPRLTVDALRAASELPRELSVWTRRAGPGRDAVLVHGWGEAAAFEAASDRLAVTVRFLAGEACELLVVRCPGAPASVAAGGKPLAPGDGREGWRHDAARRLLGVRFVPAAGETRVEVRWE